MHFPKRLICNSLRMSPDTAPPSWVLDFTKDSHTLLCTFGAPHYFAPLASKMHVSSASNYTPICFASLGENEMSWEAAQCTTNEMVWSKATPLGCTTFPMRRMCEAKQPQRLCTHTSYASLHIHNTPLHHRCIVNSEPRHFIPWGGCKCTSFLRCDAHTQYTIHLCTYIFDVRA